MDDDKQLRKKDKEVSHDFITYPELYRKGNKMKKTNPPFDIGFIKNIWSDQEGKRVRITTLKLDRPNHVFSDKEEASEKDLNVVYLSNKVRTIEVKKDLRGKCFVWPETEIQMDLEMWTNAGEHRFYISKMHDEKSNNDGTKNSSQPPEDCFVRISGEEKMKANAVMNKKYPNVTKDSIVRISAKEKIRSDAVLYKKNVNVTKDCIVIISAEEKMKSDSVFNKMNPNMTKAANETIEEFEGEEDDFVKCSPVSLPDSSMVKSTVMECLKGKNNNFNVKSSA